MQIIAISPDYVLLIGVESPENCSNHSTTLEILPEHAAAII